jgi:hypothetical protein
VIEDDRRTGSPGAMLDASDADDIAETIASVGWLAKGLVFVVIGLLAFELSRTSYGGRQADQRGALATIADVPAGRVLVAAVGCGLCLFALWQLWASVRRDSQGRFHWLKRVGWAGLGVVYGLLGVTGIRVAFATSPETVGSGSGAGQGSPTDELRTTPTELTTLLLEVPLGRFVVIAVGVAVGSVGAYQVVKGTTREFLEDIDTHDLDPWHRRFLVVVGAVGFTARALVLGVVGWLFVRAGWRHRPDEAAGLDQALRALADAPAGRVLLGCTALGLVAAGAYDMVTFRRKQLTEAEAARR